MDHDFANRLKTLRMEHDMTIDMLVSDLNRSFPESNVNKSMVSRWESGINSPSLENAKNVSVYFNVSLDYLIGLTDTRTPSRLLALKRMASYQKELNESEKMEEE